jgi:hypothetical protein
MSHWVKCTRHGGDASAIFVNLDRAYVLEPYAPEQGDRGTLIQFADERIVVVKEPVESLLGRAK